MGKAGLKNEEKLHRLVFDSVALADMSVLGKDDLLMMS